jgi:hypothetical protein
MPKILIFDPGTGAGGRPVAAFEDGDPAVGTGVGSSIPEAIGELVVHHTNELGIEIETVKDPHEFDRRVKKTS